MNPSTENSLQLSQLLGEKLAAKNWTLSTAESCTGGGLSQVITAIPGASRWFGYGLVTYANQAKQQLLGVSSATLEQHGAVSEECVVEMARGAIALSGADIAVAISGVAGPDGGTPEKPVGGVWFAWATSKQTVTRYHHFEGDRRRIQAQAVEAALRGVLDLLK
jgi:nicotinamide-nucleotide amidase